MFSAPSGIAQAKKPGAIELPTKISAKSAKASSVSYTPSTCTQFRKLFATLSPAILATLLFTPSAPITTLALISSLPFAVLIRSFVSPAPFVTLLTLRLKIISAPSFCASCANTLSKISRLIAKALLPGDSSINSWDCERTIAPFISQFMNDLSFVSLSSIALLLISPAH